MHLSPAERSFYEAQNEFDGKHETFITTRRNNLRIYNISPHKLSPNLRVARNRIVQRVQDMS